MDPDPGHKMPEVDGRKIVDRQNPLPSSYHHKKQVYLSHEQLQDIMKSSSSL